MQYILTEEEYAKLQKQAAAGQKVEGKTVVGLTPNQLQNLCTKIANEMPVKWVGWPKDHPIEPWGCMITEIKQQEDQGVSGAEWYCDNCPVSSLCPYQYKSWSQ